ncbi:TPA: terminase small subunit [Escherichia coli]|uniref:terminase small subunit n=2 Tax=Escherichia coli TaxID=562 RepID=UPI000DA4F39A|nr:terminase small subunit [Escherichia coli]EHS0461798.1 terminase small subunit [Escherichia coli]EII4855714.1 terminase small subunit [Escherichia coli]EIQ9234987.1 terminase small subunit [Escherichia coli]EIX4564458.1 terminase small subunit [Escherichia coli]EKP7836677.1 terminase small subunit [Escherichia coli]
MNVNKKRLAEIFNVDPRTIERWQSQGLPCVSKGSKGIESVFDTAMAIQWYARRETDIENEKLRKELDDLRAAAESDLQPGTIDYERYRLTKAQADAQELKNERDRGDVIDTEFCMYALSKLASQISSIMDSLPLTMQRSFPQMTPAMLDGLKKEVVRACNACTKLDENIPRMLSDYLMETTGNVPDKFQPDKDK